jgi:hypothetical protein
MMIFFSQNFPTRGHFKINTFGPNVRINIQPWTKAQWVIQVNTTAKGTYIKLPYEN